MSRVFLLRHAKAAAALPGKTDFDRQLDPSGKSHSQKLGQIMLDCGAVPDLVISSPSARTRETWALIAALLPSDIAIEFDRALYDGAPGAYLNAIRRGGTRGSVLLVGHNPMTEEAALMLAGSGDPEALHRLDSGYPTGGLAMFDLPGDLTGAKAGSGYLTNFLVGKGH